MQTEVYVREQSSPEMKLFGYLLLFSICWLFASCKKEEGANVSACDVKDPVSNLSWLKEILDDAGRKKQDGMLIVKMFEYKGETYFDVALPIYSCMTCNVYDCGGNRLSGTGFIETEEEHTEFVKASIGESSVVIWPRNFPKE